MHAFNTASSTHKCILLVSLSLCCVSCLSLSLTFTLFNSSILCCVRAEEVLFCLFVFPAPQVPGESLAPGQQLPRCSLSHDALLRQPDD